MNQPAPRTEDLIGHTAEAAHSGIRVLPADLTLRRQVSELLALASALYPTLTSAQDLVDAVDEIHSRAMQLAAIGALPGCPDRAQQAAMTGQQRHHAAHEVAVRAWELRVEGGADPRLLAAAFEMRIETAAAIIGKVAGR